VRRAACALGLATALALVAAMIEVGGADPLLAVVALLAAAGGLQAASPRNVAPLEIGIADDGTALGRAASPTGGEPERRLQCVFAAPWLITLRGGTMWVPVWPDAVPGNTFRRFWVHIRWSSARAPVDPRTGAAAGRPK
jgi:hypothetical protein